MASATRNIIDPATGAVITTLPEHGPADSIEQHSERLYPLEARNNGRPITETRAQLSRVPEWFRYNAGLLAAQRYAVLPGDGALPPHADPGPQPLGRTRQRQHRCGQTL